MYNRYIPQPDGSYRRNRMPEPEPPAPPVCENQQVHQETLPPPAPHEKPPGSTEKKPAKRNDGFLQHLLPADFDTGDLIVMLLLLLMAGDSEEGRNNAFLTMALYFMM